MPRGVELPPELAAAVAAQAKAAMAEHTADLEDRLRLADAQRAEAEKKVYELESTLVRRDVELSAARQQHASDLRDREPGGDARAAAQQRPATDGGHPAAQALGDAHRAREEMEASLHDARAQSKREGAEWRAKVADLEVTLRDEQAKRESAERLLDDLRGAMGTQTTERGALRAEADASVRRAHAELETLKERLHGELLREKEQREGAVAREAQARERLTRCEADLARTQEALSRSVESQRAEHTALKSSLEDAVLQEGLRVKAAELEATRAKRMLQAKEDELGSVSAQLAHAMGECGQRLLCRLFSFFSRGGGALAALTESVPAAQALPLQRRSLEHGDCAPAGHQCVGEQVARSGKAVHGSRARMVEQDGDGC